MPQLPIIDIRPFTQGEGDRAAVAAVIRKACTEAGFFYVTGHGVDEALQARLEELSRAFFALPAAEKMRIHMPLGGRAWRGYFPVGEELTSGKPDLKEGLYFGQELGDDHPLVQAGTPLHGRNLFPGALPALRETVLEYMEAMTGLGHALMRALSLSLVFAEDHFSRHYTGDPFVLFRIFHYPARQAVDGEGLWGVGEHTDYGVLTLLKQDDNGGLQVRSGKGWIDAPPVPGTFVCNIGDMLERMTRGLYRSTPHRVLNTSGRDRLSWPFFFDPGFTSEVGPLDLPRSAEAGTQDRWDGASVHEFRGTYGEYLLAKVGKVFPELMGKVNGPDGR